MRRMRAISRARGLSRECARERKLLELAPGKLTSWRPADMRPAPELAPQLPRASCATCPALAPGARCTAALRTVCESVPGP